MLLLRDWLKTDGKEKNGEWANEIIRLVRFYMQPLVSLDRARIGMDYWLCRQDMSPIENLFQNPQTLNLDNNPKGVFTNRTLTDVHGKPLSKEQQGLQPEMSGVQFKSVPFTEKLRNMLIAEMKKMGAIVEAACDDPTSVVARKKDEALIKNKKAIEGMLSYIYASIGQVPVDLNSHEERFGEKPDNGNTADFEKMNLNNDDPSDVHFFMENFHKLSWEIAAQAPIDFILRFNQVEAIFIENWVNDLGSKKAVAAQFEISKTTGAPTLNYLTPETVFIYGSGRRKDYNDANAKAYEQQITVKEMLDRVGDSFDFAQETDKLCQAIFTASSGTIDITGINLDSRTGYTFTNRAGTSTYDYNTFLNFKVTFGYMEWISQNENTFAPGVVDKNEGAGGSEDNQPANGQRYQQKARFETPTYKAYYLVLNPLEHRMFDFGKVTYQNIEGYSDYNANWTILTYKEIGDSLALNLAPYIDIMNECWYKWKYEVRKAKPRGTDYNYDSLVEIAEDMFVDTNLSKAEKIQKMIAYLDGSANGIWKFPQIDGKIVPLSNNQLNIDKPNGVTPEIMKWWEMMLNAKEEALDVAGLNAPLRQGSPGQSRDSMNNQFKALEYSQNNTYYIPDIITYMFQQIGTRAMLYVTDIIQFKDVDTMAYKFLADAVGEEVLASISQLGKKAMHRYGIFVESMNQAPEKAKLQTRIDFALQKGDITNAQVMLIESIKSPRKAMLTLAYFEQRNKSIAQKNAMQQQQAIADQQMQLEKQRQQGILLEGNLKIQVAKIQADANIQAHLITQQGGLDKAAIKHSVDSEQIYQQAHANIIEKQAELNASGKTTPPPPQTFSGMQNGQQGPNPMPQRQLSAIGQQLQETQPGPTSV